MGRATRSVEGSHLDMAISGAGLIPPPLFSAPDVGYTEDESPRLDSVSIALA